MPLPEDESSLKTLTILPLAGGTVRQRCLISDVRRSGIIAMKLEDESIVDGRSAPSGRDAADGAGRQRESAFLSPTRYSPAALDGGGHRARRKNDIDFAGDPALRRDHLDDEPGPFW
jgi:hypothetical protein